MDSPGNMVFCAMCLTHFPVSIYDRHLRECLSRYNHMKKTQAYKERASKMLAKLQQRQAAKAAGNQIEGDAAGNQIEGDAAANQIGAANQRRCEIRAAVDAIATSEAAGNQPAAAAEAPAANNRSDAATNNKSDAAGNQS